MASSKTRANVARVAAAAIFAAGASLAVVGTANATGSDKSGDDGFTTYTEGDGGTDVGLDIIGGGGGDSDGGDSDGGDSDGGDSDGGNAEGGSGDSDGGDAEGGSGDSDGGDAEGGSGDSDGGDAEGGSGDSDGGDAEGGSGDSDGGDSDGGQQGGGSGGPGPGVSEGSTGPGPQTEGGTSPIEQNPPTEDITETVPDTTTPAGETPNGDRGELAETGASGGEALLIIGAATMIAGGVAFRYLPRLVNKGAAAA
ncbi:hypothetical protein N0X72_09875 [Streptomyces carpaticus]|uniref:hypothetical protein n=1 Tax=Streptomyces TaxID=1883 RepID=UPI001590BE3A|nr:hypothetical protein [Streptomyces harbinensis]QKV69278.1 hypothetical protein HUT13_11170 [Streptomyces harbinensis]UWM49305.1 hypothetical protein N0X72_09875 [Streptomyces carpaticus]